MVVCCSAEGYFLLPAVIMKGKNKKRSESLSVYANGYVNILGPESHKKRFYQY